MECKASIKQIIVLFKDVFRPGMFAPVQSRVRLFPVRPAVLIWFHTQLDSIEAWYVCVHLASSKTCMAHDKNGTRVDILCFY